MDTISQTQINRMIQILENHVNTDESIKLAKCLRNTEIITALYVHTFVKRVSEELKSIKESDDKDSIFADLDNNGSPVNWNWITSKHVNTKLKAIDEIINTARKRETLICDFEDSRHPHKKSGICENSEHDERWRESNYNSTDWRLYNDILKKCDYRTEEIEKLMPVPNKPQLLSLVLWNDIDEKKWDDSEKEYWCDSCCGCDDGGDYEVSCDMEGF